MVRLTTEATYSYMQARYDDLQSGRFLSVDPLKSTPGDILAFNRYTYASNNPISNIDPDGMHDCVLKPPRPAFSSSIRTVSTNWHSINIVVTVRLVAAQFPLPLFTVFPQAFGQPTKERKSGVVAMVSARTKGAGGFMKLNRATTLIAA